MAWYTLFGVVADAKGGSPSQKGVVVIYVTYEALFALLTLVVMIISLVHKNQQK